VGERVDVQTGRLAGLRRHRCRHPGVPARWTAGDEVYGADPALRTVARRYGLGIRRRSATSTCANSATTRTAPTRPTGSSSSGGLGNQPGPPDVDHRQYQQRRAAVPGAGLQVPPSATRQQHRLADPWEPTAALPRGGEEQRLAASPIGWPGSVLETHHLCFLLTLIRASRSS